MSLYRFLLVSLIAGCAALKVQAQQLAYVYIQGDKQTPFYVKLEGTMMERYGKNYSILPQMAAGPANIEILFQQNTVPSQKFTILVPEGGHRGFLITKKEGKYALYDLQQNFYLFAGNSASDDHLPAIPVPGAAVAAVPVVMEEEEEDLPDTASAIVITKATPKPEPVKKTEVAKKTKPAREKKVVFKPVEKSKPAESDGLNFINNMELNNERNGAAGTSMEKSAGNTTTEHTTVDNPARPKAALAETFQNSDCPKPMDEAVFETVYKAMMQKATDEDRIDYLNHQLDKCYLTWHARTLGSMLTEDAAKYTFLKKVYPRITDQQSFPLLDDMLKSAVWKTQFQQLIHH